LNDRRLRVAARKKLADAVVSTGLPSISGNRDETMLDEVRAVGKQAAGIRRTGSAAMDLAWVASGRLDGYWDHGLSFWDTAGGIVILRESGGLVSAMDG